MTGDSRNANPIVKEHYATLAKAERHRFVRVSYFSYFFRFIYLISIPLNLMIDDLNLMIDTAIFVSANDSYASIKVFTTGLTFL